MLLKNYADSKFINFGGYEEISKYLTPKKLQDSILFPGKTLFLTPFKTGTDADLMFDLQNYGYLPPSPVTVLRDDFSKITTIVPSPVYIQGQIAYMFAYDNLEEQKLIFQKHAERIFLHFNSILIEVISCTQFPEKEIKSFLDNQRTIQSISEVQVVSDSILILLNNSDISLFLQNYNLPIINLFSPVNEKVYSPVEQVFISPNQNIIFSLCKKDLVEFSLFLNLLESEVITTLSKEHSKIYTDPVTNFQYWTDNNFSYRFKLRVVDSIVVESYKESFSKQTYVTKSTRGNSNRLKLFNGIYTLRVSNKVDDYLNIVGELQ